MRKNYVGHEVTNSFDAEVCQHSGNSVRGDLDLLFGRGCGHHPVIIDLHQIGWAELDAAR